MSKNKFFCNAERPLCDLASMLLHLDDAGLIPADMREAIRNHADNAISTLPTTVASTARALASSSQSDDEIDRQDVTNVSYALASMAEQMHGFGSLAEQFKAERAEVRTLRTA
jgi:HD-like signal output (HDOD) protein